MGLHGPTSPCCPALPFTAPLAPTPISRAPSTPLCTSPPPIASTSGPSYSIFPHCSIRLLCHHHPHPPTPTVLAHHAVSMVLWTPLLFPCFLQGLHFPRGPLLPQSFRLQLSPGSPPPSGAPSVPAVSAAAAFSSLCTFLFPCGPFSGRNGTTAAPGRAGASKGARAQPGETRVRWSGGRWGQGPGKAGECGVWGMQGAGAWRDGDRELGWRPRAWSDGGWGLR